MKAIRIHSYGHSDQLKVEDAPRPKVDKDQVLIKIHDAGVNPVDWKIREGHLKDFMPKSFPFTAGQDVSGEVVEAGENVRDFKPGDEVFGFASGSYAEYAAARDKEVALKPESLDFADAAAVPTAGLTAWQVVMELAKISEGQRVLIHGAAGGVGSFAVQLAKWRKARVFATAAARDAGYLEELGVERVIDYRSERFEDKVKDIDAVIDLVGGDTLERSYAVVKRGGILVSTLGPIDESKAKAAGIRAIAMVMRPDAGGLKQIARLIEEGVLTPRIDQVLPLAEAKKAQDINQAGRSHGKIVLQVA